MSDNQLDEIDYTLDLYDENEERVDTIVVSATDYWAACIKGLAIVDGDGNSSLSDFNVVLG